MAALFYKQYDPARTVFYLLFFAVLVGFSPVLQAQDNTAYTVEGVEVDVTAKNAVQARKDALTEAQVKAYQMLAERLMGPEELKRFKMPDAESLSFLVQDFEVTNEQLSRVRYKGTYTIRFRPNAMRSQMQAQGRSYTDAVQSPILVLPFYQSGGRVFLWNETNPWMNAWRALPADPASLQPFAVPLGDASDMSLIKDDEAKTYNPMQLQQMADRYGANDAAILMAVDQSGAAGRKLVINLYKHGFEGPVFVRKYEITGPATDVPATFYSRAAQQMRNLLRQGWKNDAPYAGYPPQGAVPAAVQPQPGGAPPLPYTQRTNVAASTFAAQARFASVQEWVKIKGQLDRIPGVQSVLVKALKPREATLDIRYAGTVNQLQAALQSAGIMMRAPSPSAPLEIYMPAAFNNPYRY